MEFELDRRTPRYSDSVDIEIPDLESGVQIGIRTKTLSPPGCIVDMY